MLYDSLLLSVLVLFVGNLEAEKCISGSFHRNESAPGGPNFVECLTYKKDACCTDDLTRTIKHEVESLYNFTWHHCRRVSKPCERYLINEECFFQCEPTLIRYQRSGAPYAVENVPICSDYCNSWFDACKNDQTCVENWESGFVVDKHHYKCPKASNCSTFAEVYKNGAGLCNKMWGKSFIFHNNATSCYTMGANYISGGASQLFKQMMLSTIFLLTMVWLCI